MARNLDISILTNLGSFPVRSSLEYRPTSPFFYLSGKGIEADEIGINCGPFMKVATCPWCPDPMNPLSEYHPNGDPAHTTVEKKAPLIGPPTAEDFEWLRRRAQHSTPASVSGHATRLLHRLSELEKGKKIADELHTQAAQKIDELRQMNATLNDENKAHLARLANLSEQYRLACNQRDQYDQKRAELTKEIDQLQERIVNAQKQVEELKHKPKDPLPPRCCGQQCSVGKAFYMCEKCGASYPKQI